MLETGEDTKNELSHSTAMSAALTHVGQDMKNSVAKKIKALKVMACLCVLLFARDYP